MKKPRKHQAPDAAIREGIAHVDAITERVRTRPEAFTRDQTMLLLGQVIAQRDTYATMRKLYGHLPGATATFDEIDACIARAETAINAHLEELS